MRYKCQDCDARFRAEDTTEHDQLQCPKCGGQLRPAQDGSARTADAPPKGSTPAHEKSLAHASQEAVTAPAKSDWGALLVPALRKCLTPRIVVAILLVWTCAHLIVWSFASPPFQMNPERVWVREDEGRRVVVRHVGFWPFTAATTTVSLRLHWVFPSRGIREHGTGTRSLGPFSASVYDASEFTIYVGGAWTAFCVWLLLKRPSCNEPEKGGVQ